MKERIMIVEDEIIIAYDIKNCLEQSGYQVVGITAYGEQVIPKSEELQPDLILMDIMLKGDINGIEAAENITALYNVPIIFLTAFSDESTLRKTKKIQPFGYILKPFEETQLITTVEIALSRHTTEVFMRQALEKEKEMHELKSRFVSMVSHEFRNPLSTIFTSTELLANHSHLLTENKKGEYIHHIQRAVRHLDQLLNDVILIGKAEIGTVKFNPKPLNLEAFCEDLIADFKLNLTDKHELIFTIQGRCLTFGGIQHQVENQRQNQIQNQTANTIENKITTLKEIEKSVFPCLDEKLLYHILSNLIGNAIKYSPKGGTIRFDLYCVQGEAIFRIQDEGIGIPEKDQDNLFTSFHRATNVEKIPGNGLGLAIVKQYVDLYGGEISFVSKQGVGTTFIVSLPFSRNC
jgi:signal transduction histidine kinase